jgi:hypothetical protein
VQPRERLALALEEVHLGLHERGAAGDGDELVGELGELLGGDARARRQALGANCELVRGRGPPRLVPDGLGLRLVDEELDLLDLALERGRLLAQACGEICGRGDLSVEWRLRCARVRGGGIRGDLSPPAS